MLVPYSGGPIIPCSLIHTSFWGPAWGDAFHSGVANQLNQFNQDYVASHAMNVLTQYGVVGGLYSNATYLDWVPNTLDPTSIQSIIQSCIDAGAIPEPGNPGPGTSVPILIVYLDENTIIDGGGRTVNFPGAQDYGYHDQFTTTAGHPFIYAFTGWFDVNFTTVVSSHEYVDNGCRGTAPSPIPAISPGPGGAASAGVESRGRGPRPTGPERFLPFERLLPLPPRHIDKDFKATIRDEDHNRYLTRLFHPMRHEHLFKDFPRYLREAADFIERRAGDGPQAPMAQAPVPTRRGGVRSRTGCCP